MESGAEADIAPAPGEDAQPPADDLIDRAEQVYFAGHVDSARALLELALADARARGETASESRALTWIGLAHWKQGDFRSARTLGEMALALKLEAGLSEQLFMSYNALGLVAWHQGRLATASEMFGEAFQAALEAGDVASVAKASGNSALVLTDLGEFSTARSGFLSSREAARAAEDQRLEGTALSNLGMLDILIGDPGAAIPRIHEARGLFRAIDYPAGELHAMAQLASAYAALGDLGRAHAILDSALAMARDRGLRQEEASDVELLAELHREAGNYRRALALYAEARELNAEVGLPIETGADLRSEAEVYASLGELGSATLKAEQALEIHRGVEVRQEEMLDRLALAELAQLQGDSRAAEGHLEAARNLAEGLGTRAGRVDVALAEARVAEERGDARRVLAALDPAAEDIARGRFASVWEAESLRARAFARLNELDSAVAAGRRAVAAVERVRGNLGSGVLRTAYSAARSETYSDLVDSLLRLGDVEEAFEIADASQARALQETLASGGDDRLRARVNADELAEGEELLRRIDQLVASLDLIEAEAADAAEVADPEAVQELASRLTEARDRYEAHRLSLAERHSTAAALLGIGSVRARSVQRGLQPDELLVEYLVTPERVIIFVVSRDHVRVAESPISDSNLTSRVRLARDLLGRPEADVARLQTVLERLHGVLIAPAARAAALYEARQVVLVSQGILNYLPFAALRDEVTGRYLARDFSIVRVPSAGALRALRDGPAAARQGSASEPAATVLVPFPGQLPASKAEAEALRRSLQNLTSFLGDQATERQTRLALEGDGYVHIATHGVINARNPLFSRIKLYPGEAPSSRDDGRLEVHELLELEIFAPLVYLSGCETGLGTARATRFSPGEDYATLAQAFLYAGANNVLATLWRIDDQGAAVFAERFYRHLRSATPGEALSRTQLEMIEDMQFGAPYFWAGYQLNGSGLLRSPS